MGDRGLPAGLAPAQAYNELEDLFAVYAEDRVPGFVYTQALAAFRCRGADDAGARRLRAEGRELNPHIPVYLTGRAPGPRTPSLVRRAKRSTTRAASASCGRACRAR